jgi:predicted chitinase
MNAAFLNAVRSSLFGGTLTQAQIDGMNAIEATWNKYGDGDQRKLAYILATAFHETMRFKYLRELWGPTVQQQGYEGRADLGNTVKGDGKRFLGRGMVMITGRRNYADWSKRLGIDLLTKPTLAEDPTIAARILVEGMMLGTFTGKALSAYINGSAFDFLNARRVVNGMDRASDIAGYAMKFAAALAASPQSPDQPIPAPTKPANKAGLLIVVLLVIAAIVFFIFKH